MIHLSPDLVAGRIPHVLQIRTGCSEAVCECHQWVLARTQVWIEFQFACWRALGTLHSLPKKVTRAQAWPSNHDMRSLYAQYERCTLRSLAARLRKLSARPRRAEPRSKQDANPRYAFLKEPGGSSDRVLLQYIVHFRRQQVHAILVQHENQQVGIHRLLTDLMLSHQAIRHIIVHVPLARRRLLRRVV